MAARRGDEEAAVVSASDAVPPSVVVKLLGRLEGVRVTVVGDVMLDEFVRGPVRRVSPEAPVPVVQVAEERRSLGGAGHVAHVVSVLGAESHLVAVVGDDDAAGLVHDACEAAGVATSGLVEEPGRPTSRKTRIVSGQQQIVRLDREHAHEVSGPTTESLLDRLRASPPADVVIVSDYCKGVVTPDVLAEVMAVSRRWGAPVLVDSKHADLSRYSGATVIKLNRDEFAAATGVQLDDEPERRLAEAAPSVRRDVGVDVLAVTLGEDGMAVFTADRPPVFLPALFQDVFDVAGAGDVVAGVMAMGMASGLEVVDAAAVANAAAGLSVRKHGVQPVSPAELADHLLPRPDSTLTTRAELATRVSGWRLGGHRVVFTNGCFDLFHPGHLELLRSAADMGDRLVVAVDSDASVRRLKGASRPLVSEGARTAIIAALDFVDAVVVFDDDLIELIDEVRPDVLVKGADYLDGEIVGRSIVEASGGRVELVPLLGGHSTSAIVARAQAHQSGAGEVLP